MIVSKKKKNTCDSSNVLEYYSPKIASSNLSHSTKILNHSYFYKFNNLKKIVQFLTH